jgi:predicted ATP-binding protein involved in virulence
MNMHIGAVQLRNYLKHRDLATVHFNAQFNVIAGRNGSGKTSLLRALTDAMVGFTHLGAYSPWQAWIGKEGVAHEECVSHGASVRYEPHYPVKVSIAGYLDTRPLEWSVQKNSAVDHANVEGATAFSQLQQVRNIHSDEATSTTLPLILFYQADRNWPAVPANLMQAATQKVSRDHAYANWLTASSDNATLQTWVVSKSLERLQAAQDGAVSADAMQGDELSIVVQAIRAALPECHDVRYDMAKKSIIVKWAMDGGVQRVPYEQLSDGQRTIMGLIADIARRMVVLNPHLGSKVCAETPGIVLIDELDIHLHPQWQRQIANGLKAAFPNIQFITASHSPQILGELRPDEIIVLRADGATHPQVSYGLDSGDVLEEIMEASARTVPVETDVSRLFSALEQGQLDAARGLLTQLKATAPGIPELAGAEALLKRKEILGR